MEDSTNDKNTKTWYDGLVISGGARKAVSALGFLEKYSEELQKIQYFSGTSAGALITCLLAAGYSPKELFMNMGDLDDPFKHLKPSKKSFFRLTSLTKKIKKMLEAKGISTFGDYKKIGKIVYVACTKLQGKDNKKYFSSEDTPDVEVHKAIKASCSIPIAFPPVDINGDLYVDGALVDNIPIEPIFEKVVSALVIWLNDDEFQEEKYNNFMTVGLRSMRIMLEEKGKRILEKYPVEKVEKIIVPKSTTTLESLYIFGKNH